eukprot:PhF_6_TR4379/c0_g1_i1/m.5909
MSKAEKRAKEYRDKHKGGHHEAPVDEPAGMTAYKEDLDVNLDAFMNSIEATYARCQEMLTQVRAINPNHGGTWVCKTLEGNKYPDNAQVLEHLKHLKKEAWEIIQLFDGIEDWVLIRIPKMSEEDNSGVQVQAAVVAQLTSYYELVKEVYSEEAEYLKRRGEMESNFAEQSGALSYLKCIEVNDTEEWDDIELSWRSLIRATVLAFTLLNNNMDKLKDPVKQAPTSMHM